MTSPCERAAGRGAAAGFTLIEVIVTLAILGFALVLIVGYKPPWSSGLGLKGRAAELASGLRLARSEAIAAQPPVAFERRCRGPSLSHRRTGPSAACPANLSIALLTIAGEQRARGRRRHPLQPRRQLDRRQDRAGRWGSADGGRCRLADREDQALRMSADRAARGERLHPARSRRRAGDSGLGAGRPVSRRKRRLFAVDTAARAEEAVQRAQSHLAAVGRNAALTEGEFTGDDGGGYRWALRIRPVAQRQAAGQDGISSTDHDAVRGRGRRSRGRPRRRAFGGAADVASRHCGGAEDEPAAPPAKRPPGRPGSPCSKCWSSWWCWVS